MSLSISKWNDGITECTFDRNHLQCPIIKRKKRGFVIKAMLATLTPHRNCCGFRERVLRGRVLRVWSLSKNYAEYRSKIKTTNPKKKNSQKITHRCFKHMISTPNHPEVSICAMTPFHKMFNVPLFFIILQPFFLGLFSVIILCSFCYIWESSKLCELIDTADNAQDEMRGTTKDIFGIFCRKKSKFNFANKLQFEMMKFWRKVINY